MIGKWNKSVILSYVGLAFTVLGILLLSKGVETKYAIICLIASGICDMFDGTVARRCKRTEEEQLFGIELDSLVDTFSFVAFPIILLIFLGINEWYALPVYVLYGMFGVARLANFNITSENNNQPRKCYEGMPVTTSAIFFPFVYLLSYILKQNIFNIVILLTMLVLGILFVVKIKVPKPKSKASILMTVLGVIVVILYLFVL